MPEVLSHFLPLVFGAANVPRYRSVSALGHACDTPARVTDPIAIQGGLGAKRPGAERHDSRVVGTGTKFPTFARRIPATHCHQSLLSVVA